MHNNHCCEGPRNFEPNHNHSVQRTQVQLTDPSSMKPNDLANRATPPTNPHYPPSHTHTQPHANRAHTSEKQTQQTKHTPAHASEHASIVQNLRR